MVTLSGIHSLPAAFRFSLHPGIRGNGKLGIGTPQTDPCARHFSFSVSLEQGYVSETVQHKIPAVNYSATSNRASLLRYKVFL